jgi:SAM-dependent methyltransferase
MGGPAGSPVNDLAVSGPANGPVSGCAGGPARPARPAVEAFLADFHDRSPGGSPRAFAPLAVRDGAGHRHPSSYHALRAALQAALAAGGNGDGGGGGGMPDGPVLDLACGDGHLLALLQPLGRPLLGVDLSAGELAAARARLGDGVALYQARAQALPLADASVAAVTCHMALMLMSEPAQVLAELARVLRPGGRLLAVLPRADATRGGPGSAPPAEPDSAPPAEPDSTPAAEPGSAPTAEPGRAPQPLMEAWLAALRPEARDASWQQVRFENRRWGDDQALAALLRPAFTPLRLTTLEAHQRLSPDQAWDWFAGMYDLHLLPAPAWPAVRARFMARLPALQGDDGCVPLQFNYLLLDATAAA